MARDWTRPMARARPQAMNRLSPCRGWHRPERQYLRSGAGHAHDAQAVAGHGLPRHQGAQVAGKVVRLGGAAGFSVQVLEVELPAAGLVPTVFSHQAVEPALDAAGKVEVGRSEEHTPELQSQSNLVCRLLL